MVPWHYHVTVVLLWRNQVTVNVPWHYHVTVNVPWNYHVNVTVRWHYYMIHAAMTLSRHCHSTMILWSDWGLGFYQVTFTAGENISVYSPQKQITKCRSQASKSAKTVQSNLISQYCLKQPNKPNLFQPTKNMKCPTSKQITLLTFLQAVTATLYWVWNISLSSDTTTSSGSSCFNWN